MTVFLFQCLIAFSFKAAPGIWKLIYSSSNQQDCLAAAAAAALLCLLPSSPSCHALIFPLSTSCVFPLQRQQGLGMENAMGNATANASASTANALVSLICQCNSTGSWCRGVGNASNGTSRVSARAYVSCRLNYSNYIEESSKHLSEYIHSNYNRVVYILTLAICSLFLMVFLICLSPFRRHSRNRLLAAALWSSQALPFTVIAHTLGLMQSPPYQNQPYAIWAALCLLIYGISSSRLYGIHDPQQEKKQIFQEGALLYLAAWSMYLHLPEAKLRKPLLSILGAVALKFVFRLLQTGLIYSRSCRFFGLRRRVKLVADFMSFEHEFSDTVDPIKMIGYKYLVKGEENVMKGEENVVKLRANKEGYVENLKTISEKAVTVERIWQCKGGLLQGGEDLKDKCLSFALFRLLAMRLRGFPLHKEHLSKTWDLVRDGLLSKQNKHERAFRVIEDELSFLYDYFYTQYPLLFSDGKFFAARTAIYAFLELVQFLASLWIIVVLSKEFNGGFGTHDRELYRFCQAQNGTWSRFLDFDCSHVADGIHFLGACIFVVVYVVLRILQLVAIVFSNWTKVWLICKYVKRPCLQGNRTLESLIGFVCGCKVIPFKPWSRKMSQYSLLSSYNYRPIFKFLTSALFTLPNRGQEIQDSKKLDLYVEGAVLDALKDNGLQLTNGLSSLERNKVDSQLFWACRLESITECILIWHVATSFCALDSKYGGASEESACECLSRWCCAHLLDCCKSKEEQESAPGKGKQNREVAECLSGYCAYLVAFVPALLPDSTDAAEVAFDQAILDARKVLERCRGRRAVYDELKKLGKKYEEAPMDSKAMGKTVVDMGAKLGMQLLSKVGNVDKARLWKVLVDFWTEMMLFLAPSDDVMAHAESLANGGEFITHLWALLTHVGGCRQDSDNSHPVGDDNAVARSQQVGSQASGPGNEGTNDSQDIQDGTANYDY